MADLERMNEMIAAFGEARNLPLKTVFELTLVLEEIFTNIVKYGYPANSPEENRWVDLRLQATTDEVSVTVEDGGIPFNPIEAPKPDITLPFEERSIGGLGVHFMLALMDEVTYERVLEKNRLTLRKRFPDGACPLPETLQ
jgi:anti-sigma regulatory factor (Ser/Thr protein kinase)